MIEVQRGDISNLLQVGEFEEGLELEAKLANQGLPRNLWETVSAFMNTSGGVIVLGLEERNGDWIPVGVPDADSRVQDFRNSTRNTQVISVEATGPDDVWIENIEGKDLIVIRVLPTPRNRRPVFVFGDRRKSYVRRGEGDYQCSDAEIDRMVRESSSVPFDRTVPPNFSVADLEKESIDRFREMSKESRPHLPHHSRETVDFLHNFGAYRTDRNSGETGPTIAGLLMFGTSSAIQDIRRSHVIDYRRIPAGLPPESRWSDRIRWDGNLLDAFLEIFPRLVRGLPSPFFLYNERRREVPAGLESLREAFVNLLIHTDYSDSRDALILHEDSGYFFRNPGDSWLDTRDLGRQFANERRNPGLTQLFDTVGLAEQAGSGYARIFDEWSRLGFIPPNVQSNSERYEFTLRLDLQSAFSKSERELLDKLGGRRTRDETVAILHAFRQGSVSNHELRELTGQGTLEASRTLTKLRDDGVFSHVGTGRNSQYALRTILQQLPLGSAGQSAFPLDRERNADSDNLDFSESTKGTLSRSNTLPADMNTSSVNSGISSVDSGKSSVNSRTSQMNSGTSSVNSGTSSADAGASPVQESWEEVPDKWSTADIPTSLESAIESIVSTRWTHSSQTRQVIIDICQHRPMSIKQLAALLLRSEDAIRGHVRALITAGDLVPTEPQQNHPKQKYRSTHENS